MKNVRFKFVLFLFVVIIISGCASTFKTFNAEQFPYKEFKTENEKFDYTSRQGVMFNTNNTRIAKKEQKKDGYTLVSFKIVNKSNIPLNIKDFNFSCGGSTKISPISTEEYIKKMKQKAGLYWLYAGIVSPNPFGKGNLKKVIPLGIIPAVTNFGIALKANKKMKKNIELYDISNKVIQPNDTIIGILPFKGIGNCGEIFLSNPY
jgi:hypothetical protein